MTRCPAPDRLRHWLDQELDPAVAQVVEQHVDACPACQRALDEWLGQATPPGGPTVPASPGADATDFLERLKRTPPVPGPGEAAEDTQLPPADGPGGAAPWPHVDGYELLGELGRGGMGVVYRARQVKLNRLVALKMIRPGAEVGPQELVRFQAEAEALARLQHPNIVQIHDVGASAGRPYLALELVDGGSLARWAAGRPQPARAAAGLVETLARAIHVAHRSGILHRDLKPANVLLQRKSEIRSPKSEANPAAEAEPSAGLGSDFGFLVSDFSPKVGDFGLAKHLDLDRGLTQTGALLGTPSYMAPEQTEDRPAGLGPAVDVYALGAILYELLTGRPPFQGPTPLDTLVQVRHQDPVPPRRLQPGVPEDLNTVCLTCLAKEPGRRYPTADGLAEDLRRFLAGEPVRARPAGPLERGRKWARRRPAAAALWLLGFLLLTVGLPGVTALWWQAVGDRAAADTARGQADEARDRAEDSAYYSRITQTELQLRLNDAAGARRSLGECDPGRRGWEWHYLDGVTRAHLRDLVGHGQAVHALAFGPGGRLASGGGVRGFAYHTGLEPGEVRVWDVAAGRPVRDLGGRTLGVRGLAVSPDGSRLAVAETDVQRLTRSAVTLWDLRSEAGPRALDLGGQTGRDWAVAFSPDGRRVAACGGAAVTAWDADTGRACYTLPGQRAFAFGLDGRSVWTADGQGRVTAWDAATGRQEGPPRGGLAGALGHALSPDGRLVAAVAPDGETILVADAARAEPGPPRHTLRGHAGPVLSLAFGPDGRTLASGGADATVRVWDAEAGRQRYLFRGHTDRVTCLAYAPDGDRLASGGWDLTVKVWDLTRHPDYLALGGAAAFGARDNHVEDLVVRPGGREVLAVVAPGGDVFRWDAAGGILAGWQRVGVGASLYVPGRQAAFAAGGRLLAGTNAEDPRVVDVWDVDAGRRVARYRGHAAPVFRVALSADGRRAASVCGIGNADPSQRRVEADVWDVATGERLLAVRVPSPRVVRLALSGDGRLLALAGPRPRPAAETPGETYWLQVWDVGEGRPLAAPDDADQETYALAFSPDGALLAWTGEAGRVTLWEPHAGRVAGTMHGPVGVEDLAFSPDGRRLAGARRDLVTVWEPTSGREVLTLRGRPREGRDPAFNPRVVFSSDGRLLAASHWDNTVNVWAAGDPAADRGAAAAARAGPWHLDEALAAWASGHTDAARFHSDRAGDGEAAGPRALSRGRLRAGQGQWAAAAADYAQGFEPVPPGSVRPWCEYAHVLLRAGDASGYRGLGRRMLEQFGGGSDAVVGRVTALTCALAEGGAPDQSVPVRLAEAALGRFAAGKSAETPAALAALALAHYRAGQFAQAVSRGQELFDRADPQAHGLRSVAALLLALAHHRQGRPDEARRWLDRAAPWLAAAPTDADGLAVDPTASQDGAAWLLAHLLRREAEAALGTP